MNPEQFLGGRLIAPDPRDSHYPLRAALEDLIPREPKDHAFYSGGRHVDQGLIICPNAGSTHRFCRQKGFCVEAAWRHFLHVTPIKTRTGPRELSIYHRAQEIDEWAGGPETYAGTSVRAGAKVMQELGYIDDYYWTTSAEVLRDSILYNGPGVIGISWKSTMMEPDAKGFITSTGYDLGGHAILVDGYDSRVDYPLLSGGSFRVWQSWDKKRFKGIPKWPGRAWIPFTYMQQLLNEDGECCTTIQVK